MSTIPRRFIILLSAAAAFAADQAPAAGITPISQSRSILILADAFACNEKSQFDGESATDFRPFDASFAIENTCKDIGAIAMASQQSTISETLLTATAGTWAETIVDAEIALLGDGDARAVGRRHARCPHAARTGADDEKVVVVFGHVRTRFVGRSSPPETGRPMDHRP